MSDDIARRKGRDLATYFRTPAWHRKGTVWQDLITPERAFEEVFSKITFAAVEGRFVNPETGEVMPAGRFRYGAARWSDQDPAEYVPLVQVTDTWSPIQPEQMFDVIGPAIDQFGVEAAGILGRGERMWICCRLPEAWDCGGDPHNRYVNVSMPLDGCAYTSAGWIRIVCANTYSTYGEWEKRSRIRIFHKGDVAKQVEGAKRAVADALEDMAKGEDFIKRMKETEIAPIDKNQDLGRAFISKLFQVEGQEDIGPRTKLTLDRWANTYFGERARMGQERSVKRLLDATTEFVDHEWKQDLTKESAVKSINYGNGAKMKQRAFAICADIVERGAAAALLDVQVPDALPDAW